MVEKTSDIRVLATELVKRINDETRRIRLLEQSIDRFEADLENLESAVAAQTADFKSEEDSVAKQIKSLSDRILILENAISRMEKELAKRATKAELKQIDSYISLMSPMTTKFVTREEMERAINDRTSKKY